MCLETNKHKKMSVKVKNIGIKTVWSHVYYSWPASFRHGQHVHPLLRIKYSRSLFTIDSPYVSKRPQVWTINCHPVTLMFWVQAFFKPPFMAQNSESMQGCQNSNIVYGGMVNTAPLATLFPHLQEFLSTKLWCPFHIVWCKSSTVCKNAAEEQPSPNSHLYVNKN